MVAQPLGQAEVPAGRDVGLPRVVDPARPDRDRLLVQRRPVPEHVAGLLDAVVVPGPVRSRCGTTPRSVRDVPDVPLSILTVLIAVPLGTAFAIGIDRWRGRPASSANFFMLFSFVMPEIILGVSLFLLFSNLLEDAVRLGTTAQMLGLVTFQLSYPFIIVRARLLSIGSEFEEAAPGPRRLADPGVPRGPAADARRRRSSRASRSCSRTRSTTS